MAQHGVATDAASTTLLDSPTQVPTQATEAQMTEMMAKMTELTTQMAAMQAELKSTKAENAKLRGHQLDADDLEYTPPGAAAPSAAAPVAAAAPAIPKSFLMTPDVRGEEAAKKAVEEAAAAKAEKTLWTQQGRHDWSAWNAQAVPHPPPQQGWIDWSAWSAQAVPQPPPQQPPGFADPWQQHADPWQQRGWVDWSAQAAPHAAPPPPASWQQWPGGWQRPDSWQHAG